MIKNYQIDTDPENYEAAGTLCSKRMYALGECDECGYLTFKKTKTECPHCEGWALFWERLDWKHLKAKIRKLKIRKKRREEMALTKYIK
jgi:uncharacterized Zn finger protein (UPF0148 family)